MYASQPVQAKQLLHERSSSFLSHDFPQCVHVTSVIFPSIIKRILMKTVQIDLTSLTNPKIITWVKIMVAPEGMSAK